MNNKVILRSLRVAGFRGFVDEQTFHFDSSPILLLGENGTGKSSTLGAIEWCLFGDLSNIPQHRSKNQEDLQNPKSEKLEASLTMEAQDGVYVLTRTRIPGTITKTELSILLPSGEEIHGEDAEHQLFRLLHLTADSFVRSVYLHQKAIRDMLTEDPSARDEAMDRLLGLEGPKEIIDSVQRALKSCRNESKRQQDEYARILQHIHGRLEEASNHLREAESSAGMVGISPSAMNLEHCIALVKETAKGLNVLLAGARLAERDPPVISDLDDLAGFTDWTQDVIKDARKSFPESKQIAKLTKRKSSVQEFTSEFSGKMTHWQQLVNALETFHEDHGDSTAISKLKNKLNKKITDLESQRGQLNAKLRVIKDASEYLGEFDTISCPICGNEIPSGRQLADHLRDEAERLGDKEIEVIDRQIEKAEDALREANQHLRELKELESETNDTKEQLEGTLVEISELLGRPMEPDIDPSKELLKETRCLDREIGKLSEPLTERERQIDVLSSKLDQVSSIASVLVERERLDYLSQLENSTEMKALLQSINEVESWILSSEAVLEAIGKQQTELAKEILEACREPIQEYFALLCAHPHYDRLEVNVSTKETLNVIRNEYEINVYNSMERAIVPAAPKLSTGQLNTVAIAVFLAMSMAEVYSHNLDLTIIDDPSQNLDEQHMKSLVKVFESVAVERSLIVASHDPEFQPMLEEALTNGKGRVYRFGSYDPSRGPVIEH